MAKQVLSWVALTPAILGAKSTKAWKGVEDAKAAFEATVIESLNKQKAIEEGKVVKFAYNYGRPSMSFADAPAAADGKAFKLD